MPTHASGPDMAKTGSPSITAASLSNFNHAMPACSATSENRGQIGFRRHPVTGTPT